MYKLSLNLFLVFIFIFGCTSNSQQPNQDISIKSSEQSRIQLPEVEEIEFSEKETPLPVKPEKERINEWTFKDNVKETFFSNLLRVSDNGAYMVAQGNSIDSDEKIYLLDYSKDNLIWSFQSENTAGSLAISGDGSTIAVGAEKAFVFSSASNEPYLVLDPAHVTQTDSAESYDALALTFDGKYLAIGSDDDEITIIDTTLGEEVASFYYDQEDTSKVQSYVNSLAISDDGRYVAVGGNYIYLYDRQKDDILWVQELTGTSFGDNDAYVTLTNDGMVAANNRDHLYVFDINGLQWEKEFISLTGINSQIATSQISEDGRFVVLVFENDDLGDDDTSVMEFYNAKNGNKIWSTHFLLDGGKATMSKDGKYISARMDSFDKFIYVFDKDYKREMRAFRVFQTEDTGLTRDDDVAMSSDASTLFFQGDGMQYRAMLPGILSDIDDAVPVYTTGQIMDLGVFVTNPSVDRDLEIEVKAYLPQLDFWRILSDEIFDNSERDKSNVIADYVDSNPPGNPQKIFSTSVSLASRKSEDKIYEIKIPALENPGWLNELLAGGTIFDSIDNIFDDAFDAVEYVIPGNSELEDTLSDLQDANIPEHGFYPLVGAGIVTVKDKKTGEIFDSDGFIFVYLVQY